MRARARVCVSAPNPPAFCVLHKTNYPSLHACVRACERPPVVLLVVRVLQGDAEEGGARSPGGGEVDGAGVLGGYLGEGMDG